MTTEGATVEDYTLIKICHWENRDKKWGVVIAPRAKHQWIPGHSWFLGVSLHTSQGHHFFSPLYPPHVPPLTALDCVSARNRVLLVTTPSLWTWTHAVIRACLKIHFSPPPPILKGRCNENATRIAGCARWRATWEKKKKKHVLTCRDGLLLAVRSHGLHAW